MNLSVFKSNVEILDELSGNKLREKYTKTFIDTKHELYYQQIQAMHRFVDGYCYLGYLWDYTKRAVAIDQNYFNTVAKKIEYVYVFWDIHTCERIFTKDYWKFSKDAVLKLKFKTLLDGLEFLPEDIYIFNEGMAWTLIKTHEDVNGKCYCLKCGEI